MSIRLEKYSDKAIVIYGNTKEIKDNLLALRGKFNASLRDGAGWIFPATRKDEVQTFVDSVNAKAKNAPKSEAKPAKPEENKSVKTPAKSSVPAQVPASSSIKPSNNLAKIRQLLPSLTEEELKEVIASATDALLTRYEELNEKYVAAVEKAEETDELKSEDEIEKNEESEDSDIDSDAGQIVPLKM